MSRKIKLFMGLPTTGQTASFQMHMLRKIEKKYADKIEFIYEPELCIRFSHEYARNCIVEAFLASDADILWFLDSDVTPPENILDLVVNHGEQWQAAGAPYPVVMCHGTDPTRQLTFTVYKGTDGKSLVPGHLPPEGREFVHGVATGCMFLKRGLFLRLAKPYFKFEREEETQKCLTGEDLGFCMRLNAMGVYFFVDYSLVCSHIKTIDLLEMNNYAMAYAKKSIERYELNTRQELAKQARAIAEARKSKQSAIWTPR